MESSRVSGNSGRVGGNHGDAAVLCGVCDSLKISDVWVDAGLIRRSGLLHCSERMFDENSKARCILSSIMVASCFFIMVREVQIVFGCPEPWMRMLLPNEGRRQER